jgi:hypothetical protein
MAGGADTRRIETLLYAPRHSQEVHPRRFNRAPMRLILVPLLIAVICIIAAMLLAVPPRAGAFIAVM